MKKTRLTNKNWKNLKPYEKCNQEMFCNSCCYEKNGEVGTCYNGCIVPNIYDKLAAIEDGQEQK